MPMTRISELDLLRGVALIGIFLMNIIAMGYPFEAYLNPLAFDSSNWSLSIEERMSLGWRLDDTVFSVLYVFVGLKMYAIFSLLFGVSAMMILDKDNGQGLKYYLIRNVWLIVFGLLHMVMLFLGDILFFYALCGLFLCLFSSLPARFLIGFGLFCYYVSFLPWLEFQSAIEQFSPEQLLELQNLWIANESWIVESIELRQISSYSSYVFLNAGLPVSIDDDLYGVVFSEYMGVSIVSMFSQLFGTMLLGMGLYKVGFLPNLASLDKKGMLLFDGHVYKKIAYIGLIIGFSLTMVSLWMNYDHQWDASFSVVNSLLLNGLAMPFMAIAYISLLLLWSKSNSSLKLKKTIQAAGRMALSNYIMQSVLGVLLFSGVGLALYGELDRLQMLILAVLICLMQLFFSTLWLRFYRYGPLEWCWRCLTHFKRVRIYK